MVCGCERRTINFILIILPRSGTISTAPTLFQGGSAIPNHNSSETLLFAKCIHLDNDKTVAKPNRLCGSRTGFLKK
jgi:hypothetical protein